MPARKRSASPTADDFDTKVEAKKAKKTPVKWTPEEEAIFAEIAEKVLKSSMWEAVKKDGRLVHRKANGVSMRIPMMVKKMTKSG